jgi:transposase-like protein
MLVELSVVEQRYQAVLAVIREGVRIVEVARRFGRSDGIRWRSGELGDRARHSSRPSCRLRGAWRQPRRSEEEMLPSLR